jgi:hypothetical protein
VLLHKAVELCNEVKNFGAALLAAIEKKEGEGLSLLRSQHKSAFFSHAHRGQQSKHPRFGKRRRIKGHGRSGGITIEHRN